MLPAKLVLFALRSSRLAAPRRDQPIGSLMQILEQAVAQLEMLITRAKSSGDGRTVTVLISAQTILLDAVLNSREIGSVFENPDNGTSFAATTEPNKQHSQLGDR